jgi:hypothetical protein
MQWDSTIRVTDVAIVFATLLSPIFAVLAQGRIDLYRERRRRRQALFFTLMRSRGAPTSQEHVAALNDIPLEFFSDDTGSKGVRAAWRLYLNHLNIAGQVPPSDAWAFRRVSLLNDLLARMGRVLGFELDEAELESGVYAPVAHAKAEAESATIRQGLAKMLNEGAVSMMLKPSPDADRQVVDAVRRVVLGLDSWLKRLNEGEGQAGGIPPESPSREDRRGA